MRSDDASPLGVLPLMDAGGIWSAVVDESRVVRVFRATEFVAGADDWQSASEAVGLRVAGVAWHDTEPGRLAWVSCPRTSDRAGTLYRLDVGDPLADAVPATTLSDACRGPFGGWIEQWGDWGFALGRAGEWVGGGAADEERGFTLLLDSAGGELGSFESGFEGAVLVGASSAGTIWTGESTGTASSFLLSPDGRQINPVPSLEVGEWVEGTWWSPDTSRISLLVFNESMAQPPIRVVDSATGDIIAEIDEPDADVGRPCWSSEGRFLLYRRDRRGQSSELVIYDLAAEATALEFEFPDLDGDWEIRTTDPATASEIKPIEWSIALNDTGPGEYTVSMIASAGLLSRGRVEDLAGRLIWDETVVELCGIGFRSYEADAFLRIGDIFQTTEGCGANPSAMQDAFDQFGVPDTACLSATVGDTDHEYCAPLR